jgi:hypothetical protein
MMQTDSEQEKASDNADAEILRDGSIILFGDKKVKYLKPRIGHYFQAKVDKYVVPTNRNQSVNEDQEDMKLESTSCLQKIPETSDSAPSKRRRRANNKSTRIYQGICRKTYIYCFVHDKIY